MANAEAADVIMSEALTAPVTAPPMLPATPDIVNALTEQVMDLRKELAKFQAAGTLITGDARKSEQTSPPLVLPVPRDLSLVKPLVTPLVETTLPSSTLTNPGKLVRPDKITSSALKNWLGRPELLKLRVRAIVAFVQRAGLQYPADIASFLSDDELSLWFMTYLEANTDFDLEVFLEALVHFVMGEVRSTATIALEDLMSGRVKQGSDPAAKYAEKFFQRSRILVHESQSSLCQHFLAGLNPDLRVLCCLDRDNHEWTSLHALVRYTFAEELRLKMRNPTPDPVHAPPHVPDKQWSKRKDEWTSSRPNKFRRLETPAGTVASLKSPGPSGPSLRQRPVTECPLFGKASSKEAPLTEEDRKVLKAWGLCWFCKKDRHLAKDCPSKKSEHA
jgi:hypothetical protein